MTVRFSDLRVGDVFYLTDDRSAVVTQSLEKVGDKRAVIAGGVAWYDMHPASLVRLGA